MPVRVPAKHHVPAARGLRRHRGQPPAGLCRPGWLSQNAIGKRYPTRVEGASKAGTSAVNAAVRETATERQARWWLGPNDIGTRYSTRAEGGGVSTSRNRPWVRNSWWSRQPRTPRRTKEMATLSAQTTSHLFGPATGLCIDGHGKAGPLPVERLQMGLPFVQCFVCTNKHAAKCRTPVLTRTHPPPAVLNDLPLAPQ